MISNIWLSKGMNKIMHATCLAQGLECKTHALSGSFSVLLFSAVYSFCPSPDDRYFFTLFSLFNNNLSALCV